jgi:Cadherin-like
MTTLDRPQKIRQISASVKTFNGRLDRRDTEDVFSFTLRRRSQLNLTLSNLQPNADANVFVLNDRQRVIQRSLLGKGLSEAISTTLAKGTYLIRVALRGRQTTRYSLKVATTNQAPTITANNPLFSNRGTTAPITPSQLQITDTLQAPDQLKYQMTRAPRNGSLLLNGVALAIGGTFTQADINAGRVSYLNATSATPTLLAATGDPNVMGFITTANVSGFNIAWEAPGGADGGTDNEVFVFDGSTIRQLTQNAVGDYTAGVDGANLVYASEVGADIGAGATWELFLYNGTANTTTQLTSNTANDVFYSISGAHLFWSSAFDQGIPELFYYNSNTAALRQLTNNTVFDLFGGTDGANAVWSSGVGANGSYEVFAFNGTTGTITQVTNDAINDNAEFIKGAKIGYYSLRGASGTRELLLYDTNTGVTTALTNNSVQDFLSGITETDVFWESAIGTNSTLELFRYHFATGTTTQLTNNAVEDFFRDISGSNAIWSSQIGAQVGAEATYELFFYNGVSGATTQLTNNAAQEFDVSLIETATGTAIVWSSNVGAVDQFGMPTSEVFYFNGSGIVQLTNNNVNDDHIQASDKVIAWRSAGTVDQIYRYAIGDAFEFTIDDGMGGILGTQTLDILYQ